MSSEPYNIVVKNGATFRRQMTWKTEAGNPINLTGYTAKLQIRKSANAPEAVVTLDSSNGTIELGGAAGTIVLNMSAAVTDAITLSNGVYDLELTSPTGFVTRLLFGSVTFVKGVTRA